MIFTTAKLTELPLRTSLPLTSHHHHSLFSSSSSSSLKKPSFHSLNVPFSFCTSSLQTPKTPNPPQNPNPAPNPPWLSNWDPNPNPPFQNPPTTKLTQSNNNSHQEEHKKMTKQLYFNNNKGSNNKAQNAIERIVFRLRNLGLGGAAEENAQEEEQKMTEINGGDLMPTGEETLADLLKREWVRPDTIFLKNESDDRGNDEYVLPWERKERGDREGEEGERGSGRKESVKAPTLAELTLEDEELRRLRRMGMFVRERISVPKAGLTKEVMEKIHYKWRKEEVVRLKFHEVLATNMKTAHELVEHRTGGLVVWRSGSVMMVYRGRNYEGPPSKSQPTAKEGNALFVPDVSSSADNAVKKTDNVAISSLQRSVLAIRRTDHTENMTEEEAEFNSLLDGLGPRFEEWWSTGLLPVDADQLPGKVPGYKTPFRLLPTGMRSRLTNAEMTNLRKLAKALPCHFALGRNRNHQGLATAILKLWEKTVVVKIAVKRGIQNTNNKLMADEIKKLTGGVLLLRNKYFIVIYRGKDFLPMSVAAALAERQELTKQIQDVEERVRNRGMEEAPSGGDEGKALAGTLTEFYEAQARWGRDVSAKEREKMMEEAAKAKKARLFKRFEHKLAIAQAKKRRAERLLAKIEASMIPSGPDYDQETITDEERAMYRKLGLRMKPYLPLGIRGVFDGVIENMHLHWKYREVVKLISKQKTFEFVQDTARLLEYESGGILVAIERVPKGFALIFYRGKNYQRPISLRPRNLLTKAKALKRSVAMQRHEALSQHISELEKTIEQMKKEIGLSPEEEQAENDNNWRSEECGQLNHVSEFSQSEASCFGSEGEKEEDDDDCNVDNAGGDNYDDDVDWETDEEFEFSSFDNHDQHG